LWLSVPTAHAPLPSTFLVQYSSVHSQLVARFLPEKQAFTHL
jgi:hypothetical protein